MQSLRWIALILLPGLISGCASSNVPIEKQHELSPSIRGQKTDSNKPSEPKVLPKPLEESLSTLIRQALERSPQLLSLRRQLEAARARVPQMSALPDPKVGLNVFGHPIETAAGSQRANLSLSQTIPSLKRLDAKEAQAVLQAQAIEQQWRAAQLQIAAQMKTLYARMYLLDQQIRLNKENQKALQGIIKVELARVRAAGKRTAVNDTLRASVEQTRLLQQQRRLEQQLATAKGRMNELLARPFDAPIVSPKELEIVRPKLSIENARETSRKHQPELIAAEIRAEAAHMGIRIAELERIPDLTVSLGWFFIESNRPPSRIVDVGQDAWSVGLSLNIPLGSTKYDSMKKEAAARHASKIADLQTVQLRYYRLIEELLQDLETTEEIISTYEKSMLTQAKQTLKSDQRSYAGGDIDFDRLMNDFRFLLNLENEIVRARSKMAVLLAQLEQALGVKLQVGQSP